VTKLLLVRHGETDWNLERRVQGQTDTPLNETGRRQAEALARELANERIDAVYASDLRRALDTARAIAGPRGLGVHLVPELREKNFGSWEGLTDDEVLERFPEARTGPWGDAETPDDVVERVLGALRHIAERHPGDQVLVVSHGGPLRAVLRHCAVNGVERIANCHVARIAVQDGNLTSID
jgi:uncharacterized phosphatase